MADDSHKGHNVGFIKNKRGKIISKGAAQRSARMKGINTLKFAENHEENYINFEHSYAKLSSLSEAERVYDGDIAVEENVFLSNKPWFEGRRVVELDVLAKAMNCEICNSWLRFDSIVDEVICGLASYLYIQCQNSSCNHITLVPTGKKTDNRTFDVNDKAYFAMINAGMGPTHVTEFLTGCNIPPIHPSTLHNKQKKLAAVLISTAENSCKEAQREEIKDTEEIEASFDAGWQKRGSGWQYNSHSGHSSLIGVNTKKVMDFDARTRTCSICQFHSSRNEAIPSHECNVNWTEANFLFQLPKSIKKRDDKTHVKKNLSKRLYKLSNIHKQLKHNKTVPYVTRCFMYTISKYQHSKDKMASELKTIVPHLFGDHIHCSTSWCTYSKDPLKFKFKHLPYGKPLTGDHLRTDMENVAQIYIDRADAGRLLNLGSTQSNESFNNTVSKFAPKNRFYSGSKALKARLSSAVLQRNEGYAWLCKVHQNASLSPGYYVKLYGKRRDRILEKNRALKMTVGFKRKRLVLKSRTIKRDASATIKEGDTYGEELEVNKELDTETIPSKITLNGEETTVVFDLETTGLSRQSDIIQIAACDGSDDVFNRYIAPCQNISPTASIITGIKFDFQTNIMTHHNKEVDSKNSEIVLLEFIEYLREKRKPVLMGHNISSFDIPILYRKLKQHSLLSEFLSLITGCIDTLKLAKRKYTKDEIGNYKQQTLVSKLLGKEYDAHDASADVKSLYELLPFFDFTEKDVFPFNVSTLAATYTPLLNCKKVSKSVVRRLASCGLSYQHLELASKRNAENGIRCLLIEHGFNARTINVLTKSFENSEE